MTDPAAMLADQTILARGATRILSRSPVDQRDACLLAIAGALRARSPIILRANHADATSFDGTEAARDRLALDTGRIDAIAAGMETVASLPDPIGRTLAGWTRPNGLAIRRVAVPIGVIGMIYESRPNVGADAAALTIKSGNAVILRGGSDSFRTSSAIAGAIAAGLTAAGLPQAAVQGAPTPDRSYVSAMLAATGRIDLIIPRGGRSLIERVQAEARIPVLSHAEGLCHTFVHRSADPDMAVRLVLNAKMRRTGVCGATETVLIDAACAASLLPPIVAALHAQGCAFRADPRARAIRPDLPAAADGDFDTEWLDAVLSIAVVDGIQDAIDHIIRHGSGHTDAIVAEDEAAARAFIDGVDSAVVMWNASTQFCDGAEFGFGAEIGISTGRLHARGPVGLEQLTTFRYEVTGQGQERP